MSAEEAGTRAFKPYEAPPQTDDLDGTMGPVLPN
jgi:hypothetical protein